MSSRRLKLTLIAPSVVALLFAIALGAVLVVAANTSRTVEPQSFDENNRRTWALVARVLYDPLTKRDVRTLDRSVEELLDDGGIVYIRVRDKDGRIVAEVTQGWLLDAVSSSNLSMAAAKGSRIVQHQVDGYVVLAGPIDGGAELAGILELGFDQAPTLVALGHLRKTVPILLLLLFAATLLVLVALTRSPLAFLRSLANAMGEIGRGDLQVEVPQGGSEETFFLGAALGRLRAQLQALDLARERQLAASERRAAYLDVLAHVMLQAGVELGVTALLNRIVESIGERLRLYHAGVYLVDADREWIVLQAASGRTGRQMLDRAHMTRLGGTGAVAQAVDRGEPCLVRATNGSEAVHDVVELNETRAEIALPLSVGDVITGVLDVRSTDAEALGKDDVPMLQMLAGLLAVAVDNARLYEQAQRSLQAAQRAYGDLSRKDWIATLRTRARWGYYADSGGVVSLSEKPGHTAVKDSAMVRRPIQVRGQEIGSLCARKMSDAPEWTAEERTTLETLADQLGAALESARLYEDAQRRAVRDRLVGDLAARMGQTLDVEMVLRTAAQELREALALPEVSVHLTSATLETAGQAQRSQASAIHQDGK